MPKRIQRKRTKGWRMPEGAVYVGRGTLFGNPVSVEVVGSRQKAADAYREYLRIFPEIAREAVKRLRGKDLACWCPLDLPCHADALLEVAN